tara:strand:- start:999 stop:1235 length:237 start_codon:yes stop_codon:yes gene_type:complete
MDKSKTQSRKMSPPKPSGSLTRGYAESSAVTPIRALIKYLGDRKDRKAFEREDKMYKDFLGKLTESSKKKKSLLEKDK